MRIISDNCTQHLRRSDGSIEEVPPGQPFDCDAAVAEVKIAAGLARPATPRDEPAAATAPSVQPGDSEDDADALIAAILEIGRDEKPSVDELSKFVGRRVTAAERDIAWAAIQS